jgi:hypothetical protein
MAGADNEQVVAPAGRRLMQNVGNGRAVHGEKPCVDGRAVTLIDQHLAGIELLVGAGGSLGRIDVRERYPRSWTSELSCERNRVAPALAPVHSHKHVVEHGASSKLTR